ncbi:MAG: hypothetical protein KGS72_19385 [Cyanobacteria bacterium REEB67]|nr:hypothetical protein [Cyanobacteria bacterium REEB67]
MRCYTTDGSTITRGFTFENADGFKIGDTQISFAESLLHAPRCHFGQQIIDCHAHRSREGKVMLMAPLDADINSDSEILLAIQEFLPNAEKPIISSNGEVEFYLSKVYEKYVGFYGVQDNGCERYWTGLVMLKVGATVRVICDSEYGAVENFWQLVHLARRPTRRVVGRTSYSFDGVDLKITRQLEVEGKLVTALRG